jgi:hypothetical protein
MSDDAYRHARRHDHDHDTAITTTAATTARCKGYVTGFVLSVILTAIPFWLVMGKVLAKPNTTAFVILGLRRGADRGAHGLFPAHEREGPKAAGPCWR